METKKSIVKTSMRVVNILYKSYSKVVDKVFDIVFGMLFFGEIKPYNLQDIYCIESYMMTQGGAIVKMDE